MPVGVDCMVHGFSPLRSVLRDFWPFVYVWLQQKSSDHPPRWSSSFHSSIHHSKYGCLVLYATSWLQTALSKRSFNDKIHVFCKLFLWSLHLTVFFSFWTNVQHTTHRDYTLMCFFSMKMVLPRCGTFAKIQPNLDRVSKILTVRRKLLILLKMFCVQQRKNLKIGV